MKDSSWKKVPEDPQERGTPGLADEPETVGFICEADKGGGRGWYRGESCTRDIAHIGHYAWWQGLVWGSVSSMSLSTFTQDALALSKGLARTD